MMVDEAVKITQRWLNRTYSGKKGYIVIDEDGITGGNTIKALTIALQIELGITEPNGNFGPATTSAFKDIAIWSDKANQVYILQGALFCKGYNPTGFTGTFGENTKNAVIEFQSDAGLTNLTGVVDSLLMKALLNMDSFKLLGDSKIRKVQQNLNRDYSSNGYFRASIGLVPCDGIYERITNKALIYALQIEEGIVEPNGNFGPATKARCPRLRLGSRQSKLIYLLQYALYVNGFDSSGFDGLYGENTKKAVTDFQRFSSLDETGVAGMQTWASLLVSKGDESRKGTICDCSTTITPAIAKALRSNGYISVGRYLTGNYKITPSELNIIFEEGLNFVPIFETFGNKGDYFSTFQGSNDAKDAIEAVNNLRLKQGIIYFAVDFDALDKYIKGVLEYFAEIYKVFNDIGTSFKVGIYAPRKISSIVSKAGYTCSSFVCDMSTEFSGNIGYPLPKDWAIDQISTISIEIIDGNIKIDNSISSGRDIGISR
ncbi:glycoside hydrolase domain-containing protein [Clostridium sp. HBUAS56017]|uniref:glycoside hydrolase domain-containing protein n=1 Tax=Clostridium sp. HBUAS56017 TaxID=2571128 RepID=UPI001FA979CE|nr:glycoside hydrolase domain-containing protein [Clostridium sp. HBUAS56017]